MQAFVRGKHTQVRKDEARSVLADLESLKVPVPDLNGPRHSATTAARQSIGHGRLDSRSKYQAGRDNYNRAVTDSASRRAPALPLSPDDLADFDDIDDFDAGLPALPEDRIEQLKQQKLKEIQQIRSVDKYIEGDSYPDTTSGRLTDDGLQPFSRPPALTQAFSTPLKRSKSNDKRTRQEPTAPASQGQAHLPQAAQLFFGRENDTTPDVSGFQMARRGQPPQRSIDKKASGKRVTVQQYAPTTYEPRNENAQQHTPMTYEPRNEESHATDVTEQELAALPSHRSGSITTEAQGGDRIGVEQVDVGSKSESVHMAQLDYDITMLETMNYEKLKQESFDIDPRTPLPSNAETVDLTSLSSDQWIDHFRSLPLEKWEESGDWLVEKYSQILTKLKDLRHKRREAARAFEKEIEERHNIIVKRRIVIRDTMEGMRTHGTQVLIKNTLT